MYEVLDRRPDFGEVMFQLGIHYWVSGKEPQAIEILQKIDPSDTSAKTLVAPLVVQKGVKKGLNVKKFHFS